MRRLGYVYAVLSKALPRKSFCLKILLGMVQVTKILEIIKQKGSKYQKIKFGAALYSQYVLQTVFIIILCLSRLIKALLWKSFCLRIPLAMLYLIKNFKIINQNDSIFH